MKEEGKELKLPGKVQFHGKKVNMEGGQGTGGKGCSWTSKSRQRKTCLETTKKTQWRRGQESGKPISRYFVAFIFEDLKKENQIKLTSMSTYKKGKIFFVVLPLFVVVTQRKIFFFFSANIVLFLLFQMIQIPQGRFFFSTVFVMRIYQ